MQRQEDAQMRVRRTKMREHGNEDERERRDEDEGTKGRQKLSRFALAYESAGFWGCSRRPPKEVVSPSESGLSSLKLIRLDTKHRTIV
ncbi:hypothetical protein EV1_026058 [Malus domestica]